METSNEGGDDGGPLGATAYLSAAGVSTGYIGVHTDELEGLFTNCGFTSIF